MLAKRTEQRVWAYHDGVDLGGPAVARIARAYGYTVAELRNLQDHAMSLLRVELFYHDEAVAFDVAVAPAA